jgi:hypothetical protein
MPVSERARKNHEELFPGHVLSGRPLRGHGQGVRLHPCHERGARRSRGGFAAGGAVDDDARDPDHGPALEKEIIGADAVDQLYAIASDDELHFQRLLFANCFGDYYTRTGIDVRTRELLTFSMLISLGGCEPQAKGQVAAN